MKSINLKRMALLISLIIIFAASTSAYALDIPGGRYTVGIDIPAGDYTISIEKQSTNLTVWGSEYQNYELNGGLLLNVPLNAESKPTLGKVTLNEGNVIDFTKEIVMEKYIGLEFSADGKNIVPGGRYIVGSDIPAGNYSISIEKQSTNLTVWGSEYQNYELNGGLLLNVVLNADSNPTVGKIVLEEGNVIDFTSELIISSYKGFSFDATPEPTAEPTPEPTVEPTPEATAEAEPVEEAVLAEGEQAAVKPEAAPTVTYEELKKGDKGEKVKVLQSKLIAKGYLSGAADGDFGGKTETAVKEFQMANGLEITGIADNAMQQILFYVEPIDLANMVLTVGSKGEEVKSAQQRLIDLNYLKGTADGAFGNMTASAVKDYQIAAGLPVTGEIDATTMNSMMSADAPKATVYESMKYKELSRNASAYVGTHYKFNGTISWISENVNNATSYTTVTLGINTRGKYDDLVYIQYDREEGETRYLEGDRIVVYAEFSGLYSYEAINGATITCPRFELDKIELR